MYVCVRKQYGNKRKNLTHFNEIVTQKFKRN